MSGRRLGLVVMLALVFSATAGAAGALADTAPSQWQPTAGDTVRTLRTCPMAVSSPTTPECWSMTEDSSAWMAMPSGSPYPWGQCTYYVGVMRPDIWNDRAPPTADPLNDWDAWTWVQHAQAEGLSVDGNPRAGDVMVYSRAALGNDTGHVAMVDAFAGTDPASGDLLVTVSEMNVDGLDDASQGQGDTMTLMLPRSQLVPGMIQFIHRPAPGYAAPAWPAGSNPQGAGPASQTPAPSLAVSVSANHVDAISQSTAPLSATVTTVPGNVVVKRLSFTPNGEISLGLPTGTYKVCVFQAASDVWSASSACASGAWVSTVNATLTLGRPHRSGHRFTVPVDLGPQQALSIAAATAPFVAQVRVTIKRTTGTRRHRAIVARIVYAAARQLRAGSQVLSLPVAAARGVVLSVSVVVRSRPGIRVASAQTSVRVR
jgi:surface antigen